MQAFDPARNHSYLDSLLALTSLTKWHRRNIDLYNHVMIASHEKYKVDQKALVAS
jgi:hypothetical protein